MLIFLQKNKIDIMQRVIITLCIISIPFFQSFSKRYSKTNLKIENTPSYEKIPNEVCRLQIYNHPSLSVEKELKEEYLKE